MSSSNKTINKYPNSFPMIPEPRKPSDHIQTTRISTFTPELLTIREFIKWSQENKILVNNEKNCKEKNGQTHNTKN